MESKEEILEREVRTIIPILARRCGVMEDEVVGVMYRIINEKLNKKGE